MKVLNLIIASVWPAFWLLSALWSVGKTRKLPTEYIWTGEIVIEMALVVVPAAVIAYWAGRASATIKDDDK